MKGKWDQASLIKYSLSPGKETMKKPPMAVLADVSGYMKSRVILTAAELDLFTQLSERSLSAKELAVKLTLDERVTTRILDFLITLGLVEKRENRYSITEKGAFLSDSHPQTLLPMVLHLNNLWSNWSRLTDMVKTGTNPALKPILDTDDDAVRDAFIRGMHVLSKKRSGEIAAAYDLSPFNRMLDIGGASGTYTVAFLKKNPHLKGVLFDLKKVIPLADTRLRAEGLRDRIELVAGDFYKDELPSGCDLAFLSAVIHQNSPAQNLQLYQKIYRALDESGVLLIRDVIMDDTRTKPSDGALFALNMLVNTPAGDTYTFKEVKAPLEAAGFTDVQLIESGERTDSLVEARKPKR